MREVNIGPNRRGRAGGPSFACAACGINDLIVIFRRIEGQDGVVSGLCWHGQEGGQSISMERKSGKKEPAGSLTGRGGDRTVQRGLRGQRWTAGKEGRRSAERSPSDIARDVKRRCRAGATFVTRQRAGNGIGPGCGIVRGKGSVWGNEGRTGLCSGHL